MPPTQTLFRPCKPIICCTIKRSSRLRTEIRLPLLFLQSAYSQTERKKMTERARVSESLNLCLVNILYRSLSCQMVTSVCTWASFHDLGDVNSLQQRSSDSIQPRGQGSGRNGMSGSVRQKVLKLHPDPSYKSEMYTGLEQLGAE